MGAPTLGGRKAGNTKKAPSKREMRSHGIGSKRRLTTKLIRQFASLMKQGMPVDLCCDLLEVSTERFWTWQREGNAYLNGGGGAEEHAICAEFVTKTKKAHAMYRKEQIEHLHEDDDWHRRLEILQRRDRRNFGRNDIGGAIAEEYDPDDKFL